MDFQQNLFTTKKSRKLSGIAMLTILFPLLILIIGLTLGLTYSSFQSTAESNGTLSFAVNGHQGTLNLSNTKVIGYDSQDLTLVFTLASDTGYDTPIITSIKMGGTTLTKDGNNFKSGTTIIATYNSSTLTINRANVIGNLEINGSSSAKTYTVTIAKDNASYGTVSASSITNVPYGSAITVNNNAITVNGVTITATPIDSTGYTTVFAGWTNPAIVTGATTVTANFIRTINSYSIDYVLNGGSHGANHPASATYNTAFTVNNPTKTGHTFNGWYITGMDSITHTYGSSTTMNTTISSTQETSFNNLRSTSGVVTFTANWTINSYTITVTARSEKVDGTLETTTTGGVVSGGGTYNFGTNIKNQLSNTPATGFNFTNYYTDISCTNELSASATLTSNITIYAKFSRKTFALTLNKGTGISSVTGAGTYRYGATASISATVSTGYSWANWSVTGGNSPANTSSMSTTITITQATTLQANATVNTYTLEVIYAYDNSVTGHIYNVAYGSEITYWLRYDGVICTLSCSEGDLTLYFDFQAPLDVAGLFEDRSGNVHVVKDIEPGESATFTMPARNYTVYWDYI